MFTPVGWRVWLAIVSGSMTLAGVLSFLSVGVTSQQYRGVVWAALWIPAGLIGIVSAVISRPPTGLLYQLLPVVYATGAAARSVALVQVEAWVGAISWGMVAYLIAWGWSRAMAPAAVHHARNGKT